MIFLFLEKKRFSYEFLGLMKYFNPSFPNSPIDGGEGMASKEKTLFFCELSILICGILCDVYFS